MMRLILAIVMAHTLSSCHLRCPRKTVTAIDVLRMTDEQIWDLHYRNQERIRKEREDQAGLEQ